MPNASASLGDTHNSFYFFFLFFFFLIDENLVTDAISADIEFGYRTDHSAVTITFRFTERARGRTFWKFNSSLLKDIEYVRRTKETIEKTKQNYAKNADSVDIFHDDNLE